MLIVSALADKFVVSHGAKLKTRLSKENTYGKQFAKAEPKAVFEHIHGHDPSPNGSYKTWLTHNYLNGGIRHIEDMPRAHEALKLFDKNKHKLSNKDIQSYKSLPDLETTVKPFENQAAKDGGSEWSQKGKQFIADKQATELHNDKDYHIVTPHTTKASQHFGTNTKWCTAARNGNMFNDYNSEGKLHYVLHKPTNTRYAFYIPNANNEEKEAQGFDEKDDALDAPKFAKDHSKAANVLAKHIPVMHRHVVGLQPTKEELDELSQSKNSEHRWVAAKYGDKSHLDKLVHDSSPLVLERVAMRGYKDHLDKLINNEHTSVRGIVAEKGNKDHWDKLVNDKSPEVRRSVARHGDKDHLDKLVNDKNSSVRAAVGDRGNKEHLDKLVDDPNPEVRYNVAAHKHKEHLDKLLNDPVPEVRESVVWNGNRNHVLKLTKDTDATVRRVANARLKRMRDKERTMKNSGKTN